MAASALGVLHSTDPKILSQLKNVVGYMLFQNIPMFHKVYTFTASECTNSPRTEIFLCPVTGFISGVLLEQIPFGQSHPAVAAERTLPTFPTMSVKIVDVLKACKQSRMDQALGLLEVSKNR